MMKIISISIFFCFFLITGYSQEVLFSVTENAAAKNFYQLNQGVKKALKVDTLELPFIDDFADSYVKPKSTHWTDQYAYINNRYSLNPVTAGIATLDAYDYNGAPYKRATPIPYIADFLTSVPINLEYLPSDNIFLSFFYMAKGIGEQPGQEDILRLEFFDVETEEWDSIWSTPGKIMSEFENVMIPVSNSKYLKKGFQFRFYNMATLSSNTDYADEFSNYDHWHLDYIKLDKNRNINDTVLHDVSFVKPVSSLLKDYESIPWDHIREAYFTQINPFISTTITNLDDISRNVTKYVRIKDLETNYIYKTLSTANDFQKGETLPYSFEYDYPFEIDPLSPSPSFFEVSTILETDAFDYKNNDTLRRTQIFNDYYALDDGSSEYGYGLSAQGTSNAMVAVKFTSYKPDSLRAVDMYFNQIVDSLNLKYYFMLNVWDDNDGFPGNLIYSQAGERPMYSEELNQYKRYELDSVIFIEGDFYVGWRKTVDKLANIGCDLNTNNRSRNFVNLGPNWKQSIVPGSIMIRPVFSFGPLNTRIENIADEPVIKLYPNPADQYFKVESKDLGHKPDISIFDITGRKMLNINSYEGDNIYTDQLPNGVYLLSVYNKELKIRINKKFIIRH